MFNNLQNLGWGLVGFALIIGMGSVLLHRFGGAVADCASHFPANATCLVSSWNNTLNECACYNGTKQLSWGDPTSTGWVSTDYLITELGSSGLAGWTPAIVAISVGMLIFGAFLVGGGAGRKY